MTCVHNELGSSIMVALLLSLTSCESQEAQPESLRAGSSTSPTIGADPATAETSQEVPASGTGAARRSQTPVMSQPWIQWGVRSFNGTLLKSSTEQVVIAFGGKSRTEALESLYVGKLESHGWEIEAQWQEEERRAAAMIRTPKADATDELDSTGRTAERICVFLSPSEDSTRRLAWLELPGPSAHLGNCVEGSPLPPLHASDLEPTPPKSAPGTP